MLYEFNGKKPNVHPEAHVCESAVIIGDVTIDAYCYIGPSAVIRGDSVPVTIGYGTAVEDGVIIHGGGEPGVPTRIGEKVTIGHGAIVHSNVLADYCNIGMGAITSLGSEIGEFAIVAEGAVVKRGQKVPPRVVVGGAPAKVLRELHDKEIELWNMNKQAYIDLAIQYNTPGMLKRID